MAHFAKVENNVVLDVIVISNEILEEESLSFPETERIGKDFISNVLKLSGNWMQTSYNKSFRYNYAGIGFRFDPDIGEHGAFIGPQPFPSWVLNESCIWEAPKVMPRDDNVYFWDEKTQEWQAVTD